MPEHQDASGGDRNIIRKLHAGGQSLGEISRLLRISKTTAPNCDGFLIFLLPWTGACSLEG